MSRELNTLAAAYALDALAPIELSDFESRLPDYPELEREVAELRSAAALLARPIAVEPPAWLRASVLAQVSATRQLPPRVPEADHRGVQAAVEESPILRAVPAAPVHPTGTNGGSVVLPPGAQGSRSVSDIGVHRARKAARLSGARRTVATAAVAAAAAVAVVIGYQQVHPPTTSPIAGVLQQPDARVTQVGVGTTGKAILAWSETEKRVVVQVTSLADAPTGRTYQLWLIRSGGAVSEGTFVPTSGSATLPADDVRSGDAVGITVEPAGGSRQPTTKPILDVALT